jgi:hypothetical protein
MDVNTEVLVPIWVLKNVVDRDYEEWAMFNNPAIMIGDPYYTANLLEEDETVKKDKFPQYDSTTKMLETLEKYGIKFDVDTGGWLD